MQLNGVSPVWISMCVLRLLALVKELSHCMQVKYFSPMCLYLEVSSLSAGVIALCAVERLSPECVSMCVLKLLTLAQEKSHCVQPKYFSPEWESMCVLILEASVQQ